MNNESEIWNGKIDRELINASLQCGSESSFWTLFGRIIIVQTYSVSNNSNYYECDDCCKSPQCTETALFLCFRNFYKYVNRLPLFSRTHEKIQ
jgi:hypothetical protein